MAPGAGVCSHPLIYPKTELSPYTQVSLMCLLICRRWGFHRDHPSSARRMRVINAWDLKISIKSMNSRGMVEVLLTVQLPTFAAVVDIRFQALDTISQDAVQGKERQENHQCLFPAEGSTNLPTKSLLSMTTGKRKPQESPKHPHPERGKTTQATR